MIDVNNIKLKKKQKYSNDFEFIPLKYNDHDLLIQTPLLLSNGIKKKYDKDYIILSMINIKNDNDIMLFCNNLSNIYTYIKRNLKNKSLIINKFLKSDNSDILLSCKININSCCIYNQYKEKMDTMNSNSYGEFILHLSGLWIHSEQVYFDWHILQVKIHIPFTLDNYSFIDNSNYVNPYKHKSIPPPPPLPIKHISNKPTIQTNNNKNTNINNKVCNVKHELHEELKKRIFTLKKNI